jgi:hypothetical protein
MLGIKYACSTKKMMTIKEKKLEQEKGKNNFKEKK